MWYIHFVFVWSIVFSHVLKFINFIILYLDINVNDVKCMGVCF